jgi:hypothetical protein
VVYFYFFNNHPLGFKLKNFDSDTVLSYYVPTSWPKSLKKLVIHLYFNIFIYTLILSLTCSSLESNCVIVICYNLFLFSNKSWLLGFKLETSVSNNMLNYYVPVEVIYPGYHGPPVTAQNSCIWSVPSSDIWLWNHTPHTRKQPHLYRLKRWAHQSKKN